LRSCIVGTREARCWRLTSRTMSCSVTPITPPLAASAARGDLHAPLTDATAAVDHQLVRRYLAPGARFLRQRNTESGATLSQRQIRFGGRLPSRRRAVPAHRQSNTYPPPQHVVRGARPLLAHEVEQPSRARAGASPVKIGGVRAPPSTVRWRVPWRRRERARAPAAVDSAYRSPSHRSRSRPEIAAAAPLRSAASCPGNMARVSRRRGRWRAYDVICRRRTIAGRAIRPGAPSSASTRARNVGHGRRVHAPSVAPRDASLYDQTMSGFASGRSRYALARPSRYCVSSSERVLEGVDLTSVVR
jgi:hypothetical protein